MTPLGIPLPSLYIAKHCGQCEFSVVHDSQCAKRFTQTKNSLQDASTKEFSTVIHRFFHNHAGFVDNIAIFSLYGVFSTGLRVPLF